MAKKQLIQIRSVEAVQPARVLAGARKNPNQPDAKVGDIIPYGFNARVNGMMWFCIGFEDVEDVKRSLVENKFIMLQARAGNATFGSNGGFTVKKEVEAANPEDIKMAFAQLQEDSANAAQNNTVGVQNIAEEIAGSGGINPEGLADLFKSARQRRLDAQRNEMAAGMTPAHTNKVAEEEPLILATS